MSFIDKTYFVHEINIPDSDYSDLPAYITKYEKEILISLLGYELYTLLQADLDVDGNPQTQIYIDLVNGKEYSVGDYTIKWNGLVNTDKVSLIAYYTFYWYLRNRTSRTTELGQAKAKQENAEPSNPIVSLSGAWRRLYKLYGYPGQDAMIPSAYNFLYEHESSYPAWHFTEIENINQFGI